MKRISADLAIRTKAVVSVERSADQTLRVVFLNGAVEGYMFRTQKETDDAFEALCAPPPIDEVYP